MPLGVTLCVHCLSCFTLLQFWGRTKKLLAFIGMKHYQYHVIYWSCFSLNHKQAGEQFAVYQRHTAYRDVIICEPTNLTETIEDVRLTTLCSNSMFGLTWCRSFRHVVDCHPSEHWPSGGWRHKMVRGEALRTRHQAFSVHFKAVHSYWSCDCVPNGVHVFGTGITLPGRSEGSKAATTPRRLQLCTVNKLPCRHCATPIVIDTSWEKKKLKIASQNTHNRWSLPCRGHLTTRSDQLQNYQPC